MYLSLGIYTFMIIAIITLLQAKDYVNAKNKQVKKERLYGTLMLLPILAFIITTLIKYTNFGL